MAKNPNNFPYFKIKQKGRKNRKNSFKTGNLPKNQNRAEIDAVSDKYRQKQILFELKKLTGLIRKLEKRIAKIEKKLDNK